MKITLTLNDSNTEKVKQAVEELIEILSKTNWKIEVDFKNG